MIRIKDIDGNEHTVKVGDTVGFKYDIEQYGEVISISHSQIVVNATQGGYVHNDCDENCEGCSMHLTLRHSDVWVD